MPDGAGECWAGVARDYETCVVVGVERGMLAGDVWQGYADGYPVYH